MTRFLRFLVVALATWAAVAGGPTVAEDDPVLRIGDILFIGLTGEPSLNRDFPVDRQGMVQLPEIGPKRLAGLRLSQAREEVRQSLDVVFRDLGRLEMMVRDRRLPLTVAGYVKIPGGIELSADGGVQAAIAAAGGLLAGAQLDRLQLRRGERVVVFDYRKYLDTGDGAILPKLEPLDTIFVPASPLTGAVMAEWDAKMMLEKGTGGARVVHIVGAVRTPGPQEPPEAASVLDAIGLAGGPTTRADLANVKLIRKKGDRADATRVDIDTFFRQGGLLGSIPTVIPGDVIMIPELPSDVVDNRSQWTKLQAGNSIYIMGQVSSPGRYAFDATLGFLDIISVAGGPNIQADLRNIRVSHRGTEGSRTTLVNLQRYLETGDERLLPKIKQGDVLYIPEKNKDLMDETSAASTVRVLGAVGRPGRYPFSDRMSILDLLAEAGGPSGEAMHDKIIVVNFANGKEEARVFDLLGFAKTGDIRKVPVVRAGDLVYVPNKSQSDWRNFSESIAGVVQALTLFAFVSAL